MKGLQDKVREFVEKNRLQTGPEFLAIDIVSEMGEVAKEILKMFDYGRGKFEFRDEISSELGDLLYSLVTLANYYGVDLGDELIKALDRYEKRIAKDGKPGSD